jgi:hypothetical protein
MYKALKTIHDKYGNTVKAGSLIDESTLTESHLFKMLQRGYLINATEQDLVKFEGEIKLCIVTGMWKRPEVFKIFGQHYQDLGIDVIVAGSEGKKSKQLSESFGFIYLERPNQPLADKMNATITDGLKRGYTHFICVGSDDLLSKELIDEYINLIRKGYEFIGVLDFYFYELGTGKASYWGGYRDRKRFRNTCGAGRVLSRKLVESWNGKVWEGQRYLDSSMQQRLSVSNVPKYVFKLKDKDLLAVDIKSQTNLTPFKLWDNSCYINGQILEDEFGFKRDRRLCGV